MKIGNTSNTNYNDETNLRKPGWIYIKENMHTDRPVAYFINDKGYTAFYVERIKNGYITDPNLYGIRPKFISYSDARKMNTKEEENTDDVLYSAMIHACEQFEKDYYEQVEHLISRL